MKEDLKEIQETSSFSLAMGGFHGTRYLAICSVLLCIKNFGKYLNVLFKKKKKSEPLRISYSKGNSQRWRLKIPQQPRVFISSQDLCWRKWDWLFLSWQGKRLDACWTTPSVLKWVWQPPRCKLFMFQRLQLSKSKGANKCMYFTENQAKRVANSQELTRTPKFSVAFLLSLHFNQPVPVLEQESKQAHPGSQIFPFLFPYSWPEHGVLHRKDSSLSETLDCSFQQNQHDAIKHGQCFLNYTPGKNLLLLNHSKHLKQHQCQQWNHRWVSDWQLIFSFCMGTPEFINCSFWFEVSKEPSPTNSHPKKSAVRISLELPHAAQYSCTATL